MGLFGHLGRLQSGELWQKLGPSSCCASSPCCSNGVRVTCTWLAFGPQVWPRECTPGPVGKSYSPPFAPRKAVAAWSICLMGKGQFCPTHYALQVQILFVSLPCSLTEIAAFLFSYLCSSSSFSIYFLFLVSYLFLYFLLFFYVMFLFFHFIFHIYIYLILNRINMIYKVNRLKCRTTNSKKMFKDFKKKNRS